MRALKGVAVLLLVALLVAALAACSSSNSSSEANSSAANETGNSNANKEKVKLTLWTWEGSGIDQAVDDFNNSHPDIQIDMQKAAWDQVHEKLRTLLGAGSGAPDISIVDGSYMDGFIQYKDQFHDLNTLGGSEIKSQYIDWRWNQGGKDGAQIGMPLDIGPMVMFYRTDLFEQAGLPTAPEQVSAQIKTWDDLLAAGKTLKEKTGKTLLSNPSDLYLSIIGQSEETYFNKNNELVIDTNPNVKRAWDYYAKAKQEGVALKYKYDTPEWGAALNKGEFASFINGTWAKYYIDTYAPDTKGKWRVAQMPGGGGNNGGSYLVLPKQGKHPKEAFEAIKWLTDKERQLFYFKKAGLFPTLPAIYEDPALKEATDPDFGDQKYVHEFITAANNAKFAYKGPDWGTVNTLVEEYQQLVLLKNNDPEEVWGHLVEKVKEQLKKK